MDLPLHRVLRPSNLAEALTALHDEPEALPIAGGTDLVVQMRDGRRRVSVLVDLDKVDLSWIKERAGGVEIGAGTPMDRIADSAEVRRLAPALARAASQVGAWPIQCRATLGGNLGNASPAADTIPPLLVANAEVDLVSSDGPRKLAVEKLIRGPGRTALRPGELIRAVFVPGLRDGARETFVKLGPRREQVIAVVNLALRAAVSDGGELERVAIAVGSSAPTPVRARAAEAVLEGRVADDGVRREALSALQRDLSPIDDVRAPASYRRMAAAALLDRALTEVTRG
jgi:carbon-monoxide dehydrogenase medium subunit